MGRRASTIGLAGGLAAILVTGVTTYGNHVKASSSQTFSRGETLSALWAKYKVDYIEPVSGRVLDHQQADITTSEGQSYALLRAVWQDDQASYDKVLAFTRSSLHRPQDHLFAWKFGKRPDGSYGVLTELGGANTASDADSDIALSLIMAYGRWQESSYLKLAQPIVSDIWTHEVVMVAGQPVLAADDLEKNGTKVAVNPSYFSPYAYRAFAAIDTAHDWKSLIDNSFILLDKVITSSLDRTTSVGLPPNWIRLDRRTGQILPLTGALDSNFGNDAIRTPWRLALDVEWNHDQRALSLLNKMGFLVTKWLATGKLAATYAHDGNSPAGYESAATYGTVIGVFMTVDSAAARAIYQEKLVSLYNPDIQNWRQKMSYYDANWAWFGMALYQHDLPDLTQGVHS